MRGSLLSCGMLLFVASGLVAQEEPIAEAVAVPAEAPATAPAAEASSEPAATPRVRPLAVTIMLTNGKELKGTLASTEWPMKTSFGEIDIPLSEVAGVKMAQEGITTTTVVLHNGDSITGAMDVSKLSLQTEWGSADINGTLVSSVLFVPGTKWQSTNLPLVGTRWMLAEIKPTAGPAATTAPPTPTPTPRPTAAPGNRPRTTASPAAAPNAARRQTFVGPDGRRYVRNP